MIKILPYDKAIVPQETGYWCGPASTQIVLNSIGINVSEADLAREIGTHMGGTDRKEWISERVFNIRVPQAGYVAVWLHNDPPTQEERNVFWEQLQRSINAGWGLVINWVAPPSNYPRGIRGSQSPAYTGGTVYHYVTAMGYANDNEGQAVWIVDPGFRPFEYWISRHQAETLMPPKGYLWGSRSPQLATPSRRDPLNVLADSMGNALSRERYAALLPSVQHALRECKCNNVNRIAMWMAQIGHESGGLKWMEEIASGAAYEGRTDLGNTQPGDGVRFKGRGPIQITGRHNYTVLSKWAHEHGHAISPTYFVDHPEELSSDALGFLGVIWYWTVARPNINSMSDNKDLEGVTRAINGGLNGLANRRDRWNRCLAMGDELLNIFTVEETLPPLSGKQVVMADVPQEHWDQLRRDVTDLRAALLDLVQSGSRYRDDNEGARWQSVELLRNGDAMIHEQYAERLALLGDEWHIRRIMRNARRGDPVGFAVFQRIPEQYLEALQINPEAVEREYTAKARLDPIEYRD